MLSRINVQLLILGFLLLTSLSGKVNTTMPIYHSDSVKEEEKKVMKDHNCSYVTHHNSRNMPKQHLRHDLHLGVTTNTYGLISMGYFFTLPIIIGGYQYQLNVDTGSSDIFIKGAGTKGRPTYKYSCPACLRASQMSSNLYMLTYIDGIVQTYEKQLTVAFGPYVYQEHILIAYSAGHNFHQPEGIVGLSYPQLAISPYPNFIQTLINNNIIHTYSFGLNLNFQSNSSSFITFGQPDPALFYGTLNKVKIVGQLSYTIDIDSIQVGAGGPNFAVYKAILDSGNTCITMPSSFEPLILSEFNVLGNICAFDLEPYAKNFKLLRCKVSNFNILPDVNVYINKIKYTVTKESYFQRCVQSGIYYFCDSFLESISFGNTAFLGDGFFNQFYTYFDLVNLEVGIAKNKNNLSYNNTFKPYSSLTASDIRFFNSL